MTKPPFADYPLDENLSMALRVEEGIPATAVNQIGEALHMTVSEIASLVNIHAKTMDRRLKARARLKVDESERVARLMRIVARASKVLNSESNARAWLLRPLKILGGKTPLQLSMTEPGSREVEQVLGRLEHGVFS
jgi:putative toxin-antitoxin system antitoxin component (TIGR02293 family)